MSDTYIGYNHDQADSSSKIYFGGSSGGVGVSPMLGVGEKIDIHLSDFTYENRLLQVISGYNDTFYVSDGTTATELTIPAGAYNGKELAAAMQTLMDSASGISSSAVTFQGPDSTRGHNYFTWNATGITEFGNVQTPADGRAADGFWSLVGLSENRYTAFAVGSDSEPRLEPIQKVYCLIELNDKMAIPSYYAPESVFSASFAVGGQQNSGGILDSAGNYSDMIYSGGYLKTFKYHNREGIFIGSVVNPKIIFSLRCRLYYWLPSVTTAGTGLGTPTSSTSGGKFAESVPAGHFSLSLRISQSKEKSS